MRRFLLLPLVALAVAMFTLPAVAGNIYVEGLASVEAESFDFNNFDDTLAGSFAIGYDFGQYRLAGEYYWEGNADNVGDSAAVMGYVDFGKEAFQPFLGVGLAALTNVGSVGDLDSGDLMGQATAGISYHFTKNLAGVVSYMYRAPLDNVEDGVRTVQIGARVSF